MRRLHHLGAGVGALLLLISLGAPWWTLQVPGGLQVVVTGLDSSATAASLLGATAAAYAAALLVRGWGRRTLGALQGVLALGADLTWFSVFDAPWLGATTRLTALTGLEGAGALEGVVALGPSGFVWIGVSGAICAVVSGVAGVVSPDSVARQSRWERRGGASQTGDPVATWDSLSEGVDPTKR
jgi:uncharacterized membrane protein (TIGR02234 family)